MSRKGADQFQLGQIFKKFPNESVIAASLYYSQESFRSLCEDYSLALVTLASLKKMPDAPARTEVAEYQSIVSELESEIRSYLSKAALE